MSLLRNRMLVLTNHGVDSSVYVFQDGSSDPGIPGVTQRFDNAFREGCRPAGKAEGERFHLELETIRNALGTGMELRFKVTGPRAHLGPRPLGFAAHPDTRVEFYADAPDAIDAAVDLPSDHLGRLSGQQRLFSGWIASTGTSTQGDLEFLCRDDLWKAARDVHVVQDAKEGVEVPVLIYNPSMDRDNADWLYARKIADGMGTVSTGTSDVADARMTVAEILADLEDSYETALVGAGVVDAANTPHVLFDPGDLGRLPAVRPPEIRLEQASIVDAVRAVLKFLPDWAMRVDPRTRQWRLSPIAASLDSAETYLQGGGNGGSYPVTWLGEPRTQLPVADPTGFSVGDDIRVTYLNQPERSEIAKVFSILGLNLITEVPLADTYVMNSPVVRLDDEVLPTVTLDLDSEPADVAELSLDAQGVATAVRILSIHPETKKYSASWDQSSGAIGLRPLWDQAFEEVWQPGDEHRSFDHGRSSNGMAVHRISSEGGAPVLWIAFEESSFGDDHVSGEWGYAALTVMSRDGQGEQTRNQLLRSPILLDTVVPDIGDGRAGMKLKLANGLDFESDVVEGSFGTELVPVNGKADLVAIEAELTYGPPNRRAAVGVHYEITATGASIDHGRGVHVLQCRNVNMQVGNRTIPALPPGIGTPQATPAGATTTRDGWEQLAGGGVGSFHVWRRSVRAPRPLHEPGNAPAGCGTRGYNPPQRITVTWEQVTTDIREARYPANGFAGEAFTYYGIQTELRLLSQEWISETQNADYEGMAQALWKAVSRIHSRGSLGVIGAKERGALLDLGVRLGFDTQTSPAGSGALLRSLWGALQSCELDFATDTVRLEVDNSSPLSQTALQVFEELGKDQASKLSDMERQIQKLQEALKCFQAQNPPVTPGRICAEDVGFDTRSIRVKAIAPEKDNQALGVVPVAVRLVTNTGLPLSFGPQASHAPILDIQGNHFVIDPAGGITAASADGSGTLTLQPDEDPRPASATSVNRDHLEALAAAMLGLTFESQDPPLYTTIAAGSTDTVVQLETSGIPEASLEGGKLLVLDWSGEHAWLPELISSHEGSSVTLASPLPAAPTAGVQAILVPKAPMPTSSDDFGEDSVPMKDADGNWVVWDSASGTLVAAEDSGGELVASAGMNARRFAPAIGANMNATLDLSGLDGVTLP